MAATPVYALPYQASTDAPNGPTLGQGLAEAVEAELVRIDGDVAAVDAKITPAAVARRAAIQSIPNDTVTDVSFDTQVHDNSAMFAPTSAVITIATGATGLYRCSAWAVWAFNPTGFRFVAISKNNGVTAGSDSWHLSLAASAVSDMGMSITIDVPLVAGDTVRVKVRHQAGAALNIDDAQLSVVQVV